MDNKILSIVIPSFNMELYLKRCLDSMLQKSVLGKIEIIIVNDGSTDATSSIAHEYESQFPSEIVVIDKKNGHYGSAVNAGLAIAKGKYVRVLDADDWVDSAEFSLWVNSLMEMSCSPDVVFTNWSIQDFSKNTVERSHKHENACGVEMPIEQIKLDDALHTFFAYYGITYSTKLIKNIGYKQTEGICYTDAEYSLYPMMFAKTAIFFENNVYQYFIGREGQTITPTSVKKNINHFFKILQKMAEAYKKQDNPVLQYFQERQWHLVAKPFYYSFLVLNKKDPNRDLLVKKMERLVRDKDSNLYKVMGQYRYRGIPYVKLWRLLGFRLNVVYALLRKIKGSVKGFSQK